MVCDACAMPGGRDDNDDGNGKGTHADQGSQRNHTTKTVAWKNKINVNKHQLHVFLCILYMKVHALTSAPEYLSTVHKFLILSVSDAH